MLSVWDCSTLFLSSSELEPEDRARDAPVD